MLTKPHTLPIHRQQSLKTPSPNKNPRSPADTIAPSTTSPFKKLFTPTTNNNQTQMKNSKFQILIDHPRSRSSHPCL